MFAVFGKRDAPKGADVVVVAPNAGVDVVTAFPNKLEPPWLAGLKLAKRLPRSPPDEVCVCEDVPKLPKELLVSSTLEPPIFPKILAVWAGCEVAAEAPRLPKMLVCAGCDEDVVADEGTLENEGLEASAD